MAQDGQDNEDLSPRYFDVMGKVEFLAGARHRFSAHVLYAGDDLDLKSVTVLNNDTSQGKLLTDWRNANAWLNWAWQLSPSMDASTILSFASLSRSRTGFDFEPGSSEIADAVEVSDRSAFDFLTAKQDWRWAVADRVVLKFGGQLRFSEARYNYRSEIGQEFDLGDGTVGVSVDSVRVSLRPESTETGSYLATRLQPHDRVVVELGGRYDYRTHTSDSDISPRVQAALELTTNTTLRASWGAYYQSHGIDELSAVDGDTLFFPSESANQIAAGIEHGFARGWQVRAEVYHRTISHPRPRYLNVIERSSHSPKSGTTGSVSCPKRDVPTGWSSPFRDHSEADPTGRRATCSRGPKTSWMAGGSRGRSTNATPSTRAGTTGRTTPGSSPRVGSTTRGGRALRWSSRSTRSGFSRPTLPPHQGGDRAPTTRASNCWSTSGPVTSTTSDCRPTIAWTSV